MTYSYIVLFFIGTYIAFINIYSFNHRKKIIFLNFVAISIILIILYKYLKICPIFIVNISLTLIAYHNTKKVLISFTVPLLATIIYLTISMILYLIISLLLHASFYTKFNLIYTMIYCFTSYIFTYLSCKYLNKNIIKTISNLNILRRFKVQAIILINIILILIIHIENNIQIKILNQSLVSEKYNTNLLFLYFIGFLNFTLLILIINYQKQLIEVEKYNNKLENITRDIKKFRHDYKNILISMREYIETEDVVSLKQFYNDNIEPLNVSIKRNDLSIVALQNIENLELKGILSSKIIKADTLKVRINMDIPGQIQYINMNIIDCCRVLGIVLDNCIEASLECENPLIEICITEDKYKISFIIANNYNQKIENISKLFRYGYSTKGKNRGIGLSSLKSILKNYDNICFNIIAKENFVQQLDIYN